MLAVRGPFFPNGSPDLDSAVFLWSEDLIFRAQYSNDYILVVYPSLFSSPRSGEFCWCWCRIASYSCINQPPAVGCPEKGHDLSERALYSWGNAQGLTAKTIYRQHSQQLDKSLERGAGGASHCPPQSSSLKPVWFSPSCNRAVKNTCTPMADSCQCMAKPILFTIIL